MKGTLGTGPLSYGVRSLVHGRVPPGFLLADCLMHNSDQHIQGSGVARSAPRSLRSLRLTGAITLGLLLLFSLTVAGCGRSAKGSGPENGKTTRDDRLRQIAAQYVRDGDLARAQAALDELGLANPTQMLVTLAEEEASQERAPEEIAPLAHLAVDLGARSPKLMAYLEPTAVPTPVLPTVTSAPPAPTLAPTATLAPPTLAATATAVPSTATPSPTPPRPHVLAEGDANLRSGPGKAYPVIGRLQAGQEVDIIGRNASGDWWQLAWNGVEQAWAAGTVVKVVGPIDTVAMAQNVPPPPPTSTPAAPPPTAAPPPPTAPPKPSVAYVVRSLRLRPVGQDAQRCDGGDHNIFVTVVDAAGNPLDGVRVREVFTGQINVTGSQGKGVGRSQYDIYRGGGGQLDIVDEAGNRISELTRGMSDDWPEFDLMRDAGYCNCKPHPDDASCEADLRNHTYLFAVGHYVFEVVFQRTW